MKRSLLTVWVVMTLIIACCDAPQKSDWIEIPVTVMMPSVVDSLDVSEEVLDWNKYDQRFAFAVYDCNGIRPLQKEDSYIHPEYLSSLTRNIYLPKGQKFYLVIWVDFVETATGIPVKGSKYNHIGLYQSDGTSLEIQLDKKRQ